MMKPCTQILSNGIVFFLSALSAERREKSLVSGLHVSNNPAKQAGEWAVHPAGPKKGLPVELKQIECSLCSLGFARGQIGGQALSQSRELLKTQRFRSSPGIDLEILHDTLNFPAEQTLGEN